MSMLDWDDLEQQEEDFIMSENMLEHNQEVRLCVLSDPDCEACQ